MSELIRRLRLVFGIDLRTLAAFRVGIGGLLIADLIMRARDLRAFYTDFGVLPTSSFDGSLIPHWRFSVHLLSGSASWELFLFLMAGVFALALMAGYRTRIVTIVSWLLLMSLQNRNPVLLQGGDNLLLMLVFWGMFLPLGARYSVDAALAEDRNQKDSRYFSIATVALLVQCMSVYFFSAFLKSDPAWVPLGSATFMAIQLDYMATWFGRGLRNFPVLTQGMTYFVWLLELLGPLIMFTPWFRVSLRLFTQLLFVCMHIGFIFCLNIGMFPFVSFVSLLAFTPPEAWDWLAARTRKKGGGPITIYFDGDCDLCRKIALLLKTFLVLPEAQIEAAQSTKAIHATMQAEDSWVIQGQDGQLRVRWAGFAWLVKQSPVFSLLGGVFSARFLQRPGDAFYRLIGRNRQRLSKVSRVTLPYGSIETRSDWLSGLGVLGLFVFVLIINVTSLEQVNIERPKVVSQVRQLLRLDQKWNMFAPYPQTHSVWLKMPGYLADGRVVDAFSGKLEPPASGKPDSLASAFPNYRWRKYLYRIQEKGNEVELAGFAAYLCRKWNEKHLGASKMRSLQIYVVRENNILEWISGKTYFADKTLSVSIRHEEVCDTAPTYS